MESIHKHTKRMVIHVSRVMANVLFCYRHRNEKGQSITSLEWNPKDDMELVYCDNQVTIT